MCAQMLALLLDGQGGIMDVACFLVVLSVRVINNGVVVHESKILVYELLGALKALRLSEVSICLPWAFAV